ncbi:MAG: sodium:solute symporter [Paludibacteraceae bacterium]|nr:sodium:solute symporter [Paludibacteraceae bacterium]
MSPIIILITIVCYFALLLGISWAAGRNADNAGFFSGNRQSNWLVVAMSTIGAPISAVTFVSVPGMVANAGMSYMQMTLGFLVGQLIIAYVLIPLYYKMNLTSIYEYLNQRFGIASYKTGAWFFFLSKSTGAAVRLFIVCAVLQLLLFTPIGIPFWLNVILTMLIVYLFTFRGGVKSVVWTDLLKTACLLLSVILSIVFILRSGVGFDDYQESPMTRMFFFDDINDGRYFWKQFLAGVFVVIATTGLDQDMMQRTLSCKNYRDSQKNLIAGATVQTVVIYLFLVLGYLLYAFAAKEGVSLAGADGTPLKGDDVFPFLATGEWFPAVVGVLFVVGFIAAGNSAAGSALTALTTSFTIDILNRTTLNANEEQIKTTRSIVHVGMAVLMAAMIYVVYLLNDDSVIQTVYKVASYTYGPLLGLFFFGIFTKRAVRDRWVPLVCIIAPLLTFALDINSQTWFNGYTFSHERLIFNALFTIIGLCCLMKKNKQA